MSLEFFDPTGGKQAVEQLRLAPRRAELGGLRCAILENGKRNADRFLDMVAALLREEHGVSLVRMVNKSKASVPATPEELDQAAAGIDFVLTGVGD